MCGECAVALGEGRPARAKCRSEQKPARRLYGGTVGVDRMTILEALGAAVRAGRLHEPFTVDEAWAALRDQGCSYGGLQAALSRHSRGVRDRHRPPLRRVGPGKYQFTDP